MRIVMLLAVVLSACTGEEQARLAVLDLSASSDDLSGSHDDLAVEDDLSGDMAEGPQAFQADIFPILVKEACFDCHMTDTYDPVESLQPDAMVTFLTTTKSEECKALPYVTPGDPARSYLYQKITGHGSCFIDDPMPDNGPMGAGVDKPDADRIEKWILEGAPAN